jgi:hypothetical protein
MAAPTKADQDCLAGDKLAVVFTAPKRWQEPFPSLLRFKGLNDSWSLEAIAKLPEGTPPNFCTLRLAQTVNLCSWSDASMNRTAGWACCDVRIEVSCRRDCRRPKLIGCRTRADPRRSIQCLDPPRRGVLTAVIIRNRHHVDAPGCISVSRLGASPKPPRFSSGPAMAGHPLRGQSFHRALFLAR